MANALLVVLFKWFFLCQPIILYVLGHSKNDPPHSKDESSAVRRGTGEKFVCDNSKCIRTSKGVRWLTFNFLCGGGRGGKNRREREHCLQEMLKNCRKFIWMKICYWKFEGNLDTRVPLWAQQHMIDRHYSIFLEPWSARTLYVYAHVDLAQKYSVGLQEIFVSKLCFQEENSFFLPWGGGMEYGCFLEWPII